MPTTPPPLSLSLFDQLLAIRARIWSPSMMRPCSSAITTRSASPSSAMPKSARTSRTLSHIACGAVEPQSRLMLVPSGVTPIGTMSAPSSHRHLGRHLVGRAIGAIDHDAQAVQPEIAREGALGEFDIARLAVVDALGAADVRRRWPGPASSPPSISASISHLHRVGQFLAVGAEEFDAIVLDRDCARR